MLAPHSAADGIDWRSRNRLTPAAPRENPAPTSSVRVVPCAGARPKITATSAAPPRLAEQARGRRASRRPRRCASAARRRSWRGCWASGTARSRSRTPPCATRCRPSRDAPAAPRAARAPRHRHQADAAQQAGGIAVGQPAGDRRDDGDRQRPGRHQQPGRDLRAAERVLQEEGQRHVGQHLRRERADRGRDRQREDRDAQQVDRQQRRRRATAAGAPAASAADAGHHQFRGDERRALALAEPVDARRSASRR